MKYIHLKTQKTALYYHVKYNCYLLATVWIFPGCFHKTQSK